MNIQMDQQARSAYYNKHISEDASVNQMWSLIQNSCSLFSNQKKVAALDETYASSIINERDEQLEKQS